MRKVFLIFIFLFLIGCMFDPEQYLANQHNNLLMQGNSRSYADGYIDGCASGKKVAGDGRFHFSKNATRYKKDKEYETGWEQGYLFCREERLNLMEYKKNKAKTEYYEEKSRTVRQKMWDEMKK